MKKKKLSFDVTTGLLVICFSIFIPSSLARNFRQAELPTPHETEASLNIALGTLPVELPETTKIEIAKFEARLRPLLAAMPQNSDGSILRPVACYVLHRLFAQRDWHILGLEPSAHWYSGSGESNATVKEEGAWMPALMQDFLEKLNTGGGGGIRIHQLAVLAHTIDTIIHKESSFYLSKLVHMSALGYNKPIAPKDVGTVLEAYMINYLSGRSKSGRGGLIHMRWEKMHFTSERKDWPEVLTWMHGVRHQVQRDDKQPVELATLTTMTQALSEQYGKIQNKQCHVLKSELISAESEKVGRIRLSDFYKISLDAMLEGSAKFNEQHDYLKSLGVLDDSDPKDPYVIIPNYITSRTMCTTFSDYYTVCCHNQCDDLMGTLEADVKDEFASPVKILRIVAGMSTDTVVAPRIISESLSQGLHAMAKTNEGVVPLHSRLFAQWMHHAFPRECPMPQLRPTAGSAGQQRPEEWAEEVGRTDAKVSQDDIIQHLDDTLTEGWRVEAALSSTEEPPLMLKHLPPQQIVAAARKKFASHELPWTDAEVMPLPWEEHQNNGWLMRTLRAVFYFLSLASMAYTLRSLLFRRADMGWEDSGGSTKFV